ncbi:Methyltransferase domain-containing protein [Pseudobutyrivibrio sp. 49]|uniref:class I SAM-dependent methyltransferase n=1 Tax=Pseudobutyrivibrio sp. 49 TaxID=1855344 RepID=UPI000880F6F6|nr:class I SAM-dependent methyltransferase [Pseudobutyrivibrio sp. 49]SDH92234.1 Methyltransferase domain-containing protein [Pseudobutyrivibrio sp. 49]
MSIENKRVSHIYDENFYDDINKIKLDEEIVVPYIIDRINPKSVVDFGCAEGNWLAQFKKNGSNIEILGFDGDYVNEERLSIESQEFRAVDLRDSIKLDKKYDLAMSLEVAEHLEEEYADIFIDNITNASDNILFSAAIPGQGGVHHVNEQWQSYWIKKFRDRGYGVDFSIRKKFWKDERLNHWRRQNILIFRKGEFLDIEYDGVEDVVHPEILNHCVTIFENKLSETIHYMVANPVIYDTIKEKLDILVPYNKTIIIYPYGRNGKLCEMLLKYYYRYNDYYAVDNVLGEMSGKIRQLDFLLNSDDNYIFLDTCSNEDIHSELLTKAEKFVKKEIINSIF